jgi:hypothetical protein
MHLLAPRFAGPAGPAVFPDAPRLCRSFDEQSTGWHAHAFDDRKAAGGFLMVRKSSRNGWQALPRLILRSQEFAIIR